MVLFVIYILIAVLLIFVFDKLYPYVENETLDISSYQQKKTHNSMMIMASMFWPISLVAFAIRWTNELLQKNKDGE
jgi:cytochrome bd-type quinol oxidase subunit 2